VSDESAKQLERALSLNVSLVSVGTFNLEPRQLRTLGFLTLAKMVEAINRPQ
jgi:hypothetical protein